MKMRQLERDLKGEPLSKKRRLMQGFLRENLDDKDYYQRLYPTFIKELGQARTVTQAISGLIRQGLAISPETFSREFQLACVATGKPIILPKEMLAPKTPYQRKKRPPSAILDKYRNSLNRTGHTPGKRIPDYQY